MEKKRQKQAKSILYALSICFFIVFIDILTKDKK